MKCSELIEFIKSNDIAVYGAGFIAESFYAALQMRNLEKRVRYFIETDAGKEQKSIQGVPVIGIKDVVNIESIFICIAVHEAVKNEIEMLLLERNATHFLWIRPYIAELVSGNVLYHHRKIETSQIIQHEPYDNYTLAVRYLAIENYYKKNDIGYEIYVKVLSKLCHEEDTARKRLKKFIALIEDWDKNGYRREKDISLDENYRLIDGAHRVSLACYHRIKYMYYDLYPHSDYLNRIAGDWARMNKAALRDRGLDSFEIDILERTNARLREGWN